MTSLTFLEQYADQYAWDHAPAKRRFRFKKKINQGMIETHRLALTLGGVVDRSLDDDEGLQSSDYSTYQIFEKDDLVFKLIDLENIKTSRVGHVPRRGIMSPAYIRLQKTSNESIPRYYYWLFYGAYVNNIFNGMGGGVRQNLTPTDLLEFPIPLVDRETQMVVASYLDAETARIDQLIQRKQRFVELLAEMRRTAALHVLERYQAPTADTDSGSYVTGWFHGGWSVQKVKHLVSFMTSGSRGWSRFIANDGELFLQSGNIGRYMEVVLDGANRIEPQRGAEADRTALRPKDVLVCITGGRTGAIGYLPGISERAYVNQHVCLLRARSKDMAPKLLAHLLFSEIGQRQFNLLQYGLKQGLGFAQVGEVKVPVPPKRLQERLPAEIDHEMRRIDKLERSLVVSIDRLREFRTALITAAVTGQLDLDAWRRRGSTDRRLDQIEEEMAREARA